ncbi:DUF1385 domain-containing protein [Clostridium botulinum]|uniref:Modification methylase, HemK family n=1 Tax=Clostridium botulinum D str. 1873 TaxID=592027 RepID=A0A9P2G937_CLOBO|nr:MULTISPECIES: DUF1385 domain-containing protein [Clostridium]EES92166.1 modification methylase, HemK family [Clostridium botulinum D str. 1873]MBO3441011.1 DUF1385 domain-containing protein [Clostridium haemolyticum]MCD3216489.1 DUF1385 domain-containing protein [Clostridium botulinum C]MCD3246165.1 DUF1385 domain-containing protein [Clostridium botulinum C]MCD3262331.1 DUF1385 domain-containing protein [Clostridium botulinum C]
MGKKVSVGGQAVIEGVMMRGSNGVATAIRKSNGEIEVDLKKIKPLTQKNKVFSLPIIRGFITLIDSLIIGIKTLNYSASFIEELDKESSKLDDWIEEKFKGKATDIIMGISFIVSMALSIFIFFIIPTFVANKFKIVNINNTISLNILEGIIRVFIFLTYIFIISRMKDIKRVFEYHGAEHKTIFCYESNEELKPENAKHQGRLHPRCGTNFLFLVMIVSIILFSFTGWNSIWQRILYRIILLPVVSGITYEIIKWMGNNKNFCTKILAYPGLMLQKLTTREPDLEQLEVAIVSLKVAEGIETVESIKEKYNKNDN